MSRPKSEKTILLEKGRAIRRERRELKRAEKESRRMTREANRRARETYDTKHGGDYAMRRSEDQPRRDIYCSVCDQRKSWGQFMPGNPLVCCDCAGSKKMGEQPLAAPDFGRKKELGDKGATPQFALFES